MSGDDLFGSIKQIQEDGVKFGRRRFIVALGVAAVGIGGWKYYDSLPQKFAPRKISFITPTEEFYNVSVNMFYEPKIDTEAWRLELIDMKGQKQSRSLAEIKALPNKIITRTLSCIGNSVGWPTVSNAGWRVAQLSELLKPILPESLENTENVRMVAFGLDGFYTSVPLSLALDSDSFIAYEMNGEPLSSKHGMPARVLIPGRYGMKQPKWLRKIEITDRKVTGYWEEQGWSDDSTVKSYARLDLAKNIETKGEDIVLAGIAYCGHPAVAKVEVSLDEGKSWREAKLETPPLKNAWTIWKYHWPRPAAGSYTVMCRVIDENGKRQIETFAEWYPNGASGLHKIKLNIV